jgi:hypothetical protein
MKFENRQPEQPPKLNAEGLKAIVADMQNTSMYKKNLSLQQYFATEVVPQLGNPDLDEEMAFAIIEGIWRAVRSVRDRIEKITAPYSVN